MKNKHIIRPYPDSLWEGCLGIVLFGFFAIGAESTLMRLVSWVFLVWIVFRSVRMYLTRVELDENGIRICQWKHESVPESAWEEFAQAYLLDVAWNSRQRYSSSRYCAYYLLLTRYPIHPGTVRELGIKLAGACPCGKWKEHVALRLTEEQVSLVRRCIADKTTLIEKRVERDEATRL